MIKGLFTTVAAAGLLLAPIAAQAGTRASSSGVSTTALASLERIGSPVSDAEGAEGGIPTWALIALFGAVGVAVIAGVESGEDSNKSPGTN